MSTSFYSSAQEKYPFSFKAQQENRYKAYTSSYYRLIKAQNKYGLTTPRVKTIFETVYDTIAINHLFIKTVKGDSINLYNGATLQKLEIPNLLQAYFIEDWVEVLTPEGAYYYDHTGTKITEPPFLDALFCGTVYAKIYTIQQEKSDYFIEISKGYLGDRFVTYKLQLYGLPPKVERLQFLSGSISLSICENTYYKTYPEYLKVKTNGKCSIYTYNLSEAIFLKPPAYQVNNPTSPEYTINEHTGDTLYALIEIPFPPLDKGYKEGTVKIEKHFPQDYDSIQQNKKNGIITAIQKGNTYVFPFDMESPYTVFKKHTRTFYEIEKSKKKGYLDSQTLKTFYIN